MSKNLFSFVFLSLLIFRSITKDCSGFDEYVARFKKEYKDEAER